MKKSQLHNSGDPLCWAAAPILMLTLWLASSAPASEPDPAPVPSFAHDVMAVLSQSGCNLGACHGNQNGKGGLRLSLRGQDAEFDYQALTRQFAGRRINLQQPERSLLLRKPTQDLIHQGGRRFEVDSEPYGILRGWIAAGAPNDLQEAPAVAALRIEPQQLVAAPGQSVHLRAWANFVDGSQREVTSQVVWEASNLLANLSPQGEVRSEAPGEATIVARYLQRQAAATLAFVNPSTQTPDPPSSPEHPLDRVVQQKLWRLRCDVPPICDDVTFVRRAFLDAIGLPPRAEEAERFFADPRPDKRQRLIDSLLMRPEFAEHWALKWCDLLRNEEKVLDQQGVERFHRWIKQWLAADRPLDAFVGELLQGLGSTYQNPPANFYRALRDPATRGESVARLFLGARLQCAQCHNHPFDRWTQDDYYNWVTVFAHVDYEIVENNRQDKLDQHEFVGEQIVLIKAKGEVKNPRSGVDAEPIFLGENEVIRGDRLAALAAWLTRQDRFAEVVANWVWLQLNGRGLVDPVDDFRVTNPASHPALLQALADLLRREQFRLKPLVRAIMSSQVYQATSATAAWPMELTRTRIRRLDAEELLDAQSQVLDSPARFAGYSRGQRAGGIPGVRRFGRGQGKPQDGDAFLAVFGKPQRLLACECERSNETTLAQALTLISGTSLQSRLTAPDNRLARWSASSRTNQQLVEDLYLEAVSRPPTGPECAAALALLQSAGRLSGLQDLAWALVNSKEFVFRH